MSLYVPTFNGQPIFGESYTIRVVGYPHQIAWGAFPGVNGRFGIREGSRGFWADARIMQTAANETVLGQFEDIWNTYRNTAYLTVLLDTTGRSWPYTVCTDFEPTGQINAYRLGAVWREYAIHFEMMI